MALPAPGQNLPHSFMAFFATAPLHERTRIYAPTFGQAQPLDVRPAQPEVAVL